MSSSALWVPINQELAVFNVIVRARLVMVQDLAPAHHAIARAVFLIKSVVLAALQDMEGLEAYVSNVNSHVQNVQQVQKCVLPALKMMAKLSFSDPHVCKSAQRASTLI